MKDKDYRLDEFVSLMKFFNGYFKFPKRIRFKLTPHSHVEYIYEVSITDDFYLYGEARDAIIQDLMWYKHLKEIGKL
jgi:hypothetical protein